MKSRLAQVAGTAILGAAASANAAAARGEEIGVEIVGRGIRDPRLRLNVAVGALVIELRLERLSAQLERLRCA